MNSYKTNFFKEILFLENPLLLNTLNEHISVSYF